MAEYKIYVITLFFKCHIISTKKIIKLTLAIVLKSEHMFFLKSAYKKLQKQNFLKT